MNTRTCYTCRFHDSLAQACRRYPPTVAVVVVPQPVSMGAVLQGNQHMTMVPMPVGALVPIPEAHEGWCGEWAASPEIAP